eukprot:gnl/MRDRNA2_/MRDRNA2_28887_c0_seq1.p1 gnl/MRDRNA2_/MRDRNA2_28887_c0~~gnl/MRDRNA2_/MRDRNA2_28887_c0_seq1.p1  ORF type:complete len:486 (+),score=94.71 gnl/MRDRNA2_/MRDRNA2_28887_c0_seq1:72-1529(+)
MAVAAVEFPPLNCLPLHRHSTQVLVDRATDAEVTMPALLRASSAPSNLEVNHGSSSMINIRPAAQELEENHAISRMLLRGVLEEICKLEAEALPLCGVCLEQNSPLVLECTHCFCKPCLTQQVNSRWPGPRVTFGYLNCGICRGSLAHTELDNLLKEHIVLKQKAMDIAEQKFRDDGFANKLSSDLGRTATSKEIRARAEAEMAMYMCADCSTVYCGGRVDCAQEEELVPEKLRCHECVWASLAGPDDRRCMVHGHRYAMFKCDSCCDVAVWNCEYHHYCERCHEEACEPKKYPCPGPDLCPLGMPHPRNLEADLNEAEAADDHHKPFVIGCAACLGLTDDDLQDGSEEHHQWGYPPREFERYESGKALLADLGEKEVRDRLRTRDPPILHRGTPLECAERLLLHEQRLTTAHALLMSVGGSSGRKILVQRLLAVGLKAHGEPVELAQRLLILRDKTAKDISISPSKKLQRERQQRAIAYAMCHK